MLKGGEHTGDHVALELIGYTLHVGRTKCCSSVYSNPMLETGTKQGICTKRLDRPFVDFIISNSFPRNPDHTRRGPTSC
jgi:hypothetical protein